MAERTINSVTSAVTGELTSRVFSGLIQRYGKHAASTEKLQQLKMLLIKIHSAVEASEKRAIENSWLLRWRDKLKEAAKHGDMVLASFPQQVQHAQATSSTDGNQKQGETASSAAAPVTAVGALSFTRNSLSAMVQGVRSAREMFFSSGNNDIERLDKILRVLEKLSPDIGEFIRLLHLEALPKCTTVLSTQVHVPTKKRTMREKKRKRHSSSGEELMEGLSAYCMPSEEESEHFESKCDPAHLQEEQKEVLLQDRLFGVPREGVKWREVRHSLYFQEITALPNLECDSANLQKEQQLMVLQDRLQAAFTEICRAVQLANSHDLKDLEWLAHWAGILREAKQQGCNILGTINSCKTDNKEDNKESMVECDQDKDELGTFVHRLESLARDVEYFRKLVYLCPAC